MGMKLWAGLGTFLGLGLLIGSAAVLLLVPNIFHSKLAEKLALVNGSEAWNRWQVLPIPLTYSLYFFNVENATQFDGKSFSSLRLKKVGPYVYDERIERIPSKVNGTIIKYQESKTYHFNAHLSGNRTENDELSLINLVWTNPKDLNFAISFLNKSTDPATIKQLRDEIEPVIQTGTVSEYSFVGLEKLLGISLFKNGTADLDISINNGKEDISQVGQYVEFGGQNPVSYWSGANSTCNEVYGTDGTIFHPEVKSTDQIWVFESSLCRKILFAQEEQYQKTATVKGIDSLRFVATDSNFVAQGNECYCLRDGKNYEDYCNLGDGILNIRNCPTAQESNIIASPPYYYVNTALANLTNIPVPKNFDLKDYITYLDIEPLTGQPVRARKMVQLNALVTKNENVKTLKSLKAQSNVVPLLILEEYGEIDDENAEKLKTEALRPKFYVQLACYIGVGLGVVILFVTLVLVVRNVRSKSD